MSPTQHSSLGTPEWVLNQFTTWAATVQSEFLVGIAMSLNNVGFKSQLSCQYQELDLLTLEK